VLAVGFHATSAVLGAFVLAVFWSRARAVGWAPLAWFAASGLALGLLVLAALQVYRTGSPWPLELGAFIPRMADEPAMSIPSRLGRAAFGAARILVFVPYFGDIRAGYLLCAGALGIWVLVAVLMGLSGGLRSFARQSPAWYGGLALLTLPFVYLAFKYFPSDPERWLFLTPVVWLLLGLLWNECTSGRPRAVIAGLVAALGLFNIVLGLLPESHGVYSAAFSMKPERYGYREWNGQKVLAATVEPGDLVISLGNVQGPSFDFLGLSVPVENLVIDSLSQRYWDDAPTFQDQIRQPVNERLARGRRVLVYGFYGENNVKMSWPWSLLPGFTLGPEAVQAVLDEYRATTLRPATPYAWGVTRLDAMPAGGADQGK
jgi:hypothetical protein